MTAWIALWLHWTVMVTSSLDGSPSSDASVPKQDPSFRARGLQALDRGDLDAAQRAFEAALKETPEDSTLRLYLARVHLELGQPHAALEVLEGTQTLASTVIAQPLLHARAWSETGREDEAYRVLHAAVDRFPHELGPPLELMVLCARLELYESAEAWAEVVLRLVKKVDEATAMAIVVALHRSVRALPLLERVVATHPDSPQLRAALATAYAQHGYPGVAGRLFADATRSGGDHAYEAADQLRLAGRTSVALEMNALVTNPARRMDQRLSIAFEGKQLGRVVGWAPLLQAWGIDTPAQRYRVAYAYYMLGQFAHAVRWARTLEGTPEDARARSLLAAMGRRLTESPEEP